MLYKRGGFDFLVLIWISSELIKFWVFMLIGLKFCKMWIILLILLIEIFSSLVVNFGLIVKKLFLFKFLIRNWMMCFWCVCKWFSIDSCFNKWFFNVIVWLDI